MIEVTVTATATGELQGVAEAPCAESAVTAARALWDDVQTNSVNGFYRPCEIRFTLDGATLLRTEARP